MNWALKLLMLSFVAWAFILTWFHEALFAAGFYLIALACAHYLEND